MCCPAHLGGSLVTICLPRLCPAGLRFALLLQALPFCSGLRPAATGYALRRSLSIVAGCLGNGKLRQQWACTSVGMGCLGNGRCPSPMELLSGNLSTGSVWNHHTHYLLGWLTVQVPFSLKFSPLKFQVAGSTGHPDQCALCGALCSAAAPAAGYTSQNLCLASCVYFIPGNFPVLWATKVRLEMSP